MANHSVIKFPTFKWAYHIEDAFRTINARRFQGRMLLVEHANLIPQWKARRVWMIEAPGTRPATPGPAEPDENLGFLLWLHEDGRALEIRHSAHNRWILWVMHVFEHELADHFMVASFEQGDGEGPTDIVTHRTGFREWATRNFPKPMDAGDLEYVRNHFFCDIPPGWR
jgi:hypothetical protein